MRVQILVDKPTPEIAWEGDSTAMLRAGDSIYIPGWPQRTVMDSHYHCGIDTLVVYVRPKDD